MESEPLATARAMVPFPAPEGPSMAMIIGSMILAAIRGPGSGIRRAKIGFERSAIHVSSAARDPSSVSPCPDPAPRIPDPGCVYYPTACAHGRRPPASSPRHCCSRLGVERLPSCDGVRGASGRHGGLRGTVASVETGHSTSARRHPVARRPVAGRLYIPRGLPTGRSCSSPASTPPASTSRG